MNKNYLIIALFSMFFFASSEAYSQTDLITKEDVWKYWDNYGSNPGGTWADSNFNDAGWSSDTAVFGAGSIDGATIKTSIANVRTVYFRKKVNVNKPIDHMIFNLLVDDGAVMYVNGNEVARDNMGTGTISHTSYASSAVGGSNEGDYEEFIVDGSDLVVGENTIAVEVHNATSGSSDIGFDMEVIAVAMVLDGDDWDYWDNGSAASAGWNSDTSYTLTSWDNGTGIFGYGGIGGSTVTTTVSYGGDPNDKYPTTYFRRVFTVLDTGDVDYFDLSYMRDDGIVIYINGEEVHRNGIASGTVAYGDYANQTIGGSDEDAWNDISFDKPTLYPGENVIAAEVHQTNATSSDISFNLELRGQKYGEVEITRGPYIQNVTDSSVIISWRTGAPSTSHVAFGTTHGTYNLTADSSAGVIDHELYIDGLTPNTKYYYLVGTDGTDTLSRYDDSYYFRTNPTPGSSDEKVSFWVLGDGGQVGTGQTGVHTTFLATDWADSMDLILMLGDNAYNDGTDTEFETGLFSTRLDSVIRNTPMYSTVGNHEVRYVGAHDVSTPETTPYYLIYNFPTNGEAGGEPSGTESYYSFDVGNVHFISFNAEEEDLDSSTSAMWAWAEDDLQQNTSDWIVAIVHQGPYSKIGTHNSDSENEHVEFRENYVPLLERFGADLLMSGHNHAYERTELLAGHYGVSNTFNSSTHVVSSGLGRAPGSGSLTNDCAYEKSTDNVHKNGGAYVVAGSSSKVSSTSGSAHDATVVSHRTYGSCYVEVDENKMSLWYLESDGDTADYFQVFKDIEYDSVHVLTDSTVTLTASWPGGPYLWSTGETTRSITATPGVDSTFYVQNLAGSTPCMIDTFNVDFPEIVRYPFSEIDTTGLSFLDADGSAVIRSTERTEVDANGWYYYCNALDPNALLFAVRNSTTGGNTLPIDAVIDYIELRKSNLADRTKTGQDSVFTVMPYDWNVATLTQPNGKMDIKFYFDPQELADYTSYTDSIEATNTDFVATREWFKAHQGSGVSFMNSDITVDSIVNAIDLTSLLVAAPNYTTGVGSIDGSPWINRGNGKNYIQLNGLDSFSGGGLSMSLFDPTPVPVTWLSFNASWIGNDAQLLWQTASESNSSKFIVQRQINGVWEDRETVIAAGNSTEVKTYQSEDKGAALLGQDNIPYRIKQIDFSGVISYSDVEILTVDRANIVSLYPNPVNNFLNLELNDEMIATATSLKIFSIDGKLITEFNVTESFHKFDISDLVPGNYVVALKSNKELYTFRLVKE